MPGQDTQVPQAIGARLQHFDLHHHLRLGLVDVADDLLRQQQLVRCVAHNDGILRVELLNALQVQQLAQPRHNFSNILRLKGIRQINRLDDLLFVIAALLRLVGDHQDDVFRDRLPERFALQRHDFQRLLHRHIVQMRRDAPGRKVRVKNHRKPRQFPDRLENDLRVIVHRQTNGSTRQPLDFRRHRCQGCLVRISRRLGRRIGGAIFLRDHFDCLAKLLVRHRARRIDRLRPLEFGCCALQVALFPHLKAVFNVKFTRFEACPVQLDLVAGVVRISFDGFLVVDERGVVVLNRLRSFTLVVIGLALRTACCEQSETNTQE